MVLSAAATFVNAAASAEGSAAAVRDNAEHVQYANSDLSHYVFIPLSTESFNRLDKPAMALLKMKLNVLRREAFFTRMALL